MKGKMESEGGFLKMFASISYVTVWSCTYTVRGTNTDDPPNNHSNNSQEWNTC